MTGELAEKLDCEADEVSKDGEADLEQVGPSVGVEHHSRELPDIGLDRGRILEQEFCWKEFNRASQGRWRAIGKKSDAEVDDLNAYQRGGAEDETRKGGRGDDLLWGVSRVGYRAFAETKGFVFDRAQDF
jgi:hypothetical protein